MEPSARCLLKSLHGKYRRNARHKAYSVAELRGASIAHLASHDILYISAGAHTYAGNAEALCVKVCSPVRVESAGLILSRMKTNKHHLSQPQGTSLGSPCAHDVLPTITTHAINLFKSALKGLDGPSMGDPIEL